MNLKCIRISLRIFIMQYCNIPLDKYTLLPSLVIMTVAMLKLVIGILYITIEGSEKENPPSLPLIQFTKIPEVVKIVQVILGVSNCIYSFIFFYHAYMIYSAIKNKKVKNLLDILSVIPVVFVDAIFKLIYYKTTLGLLFVIEQIIIISIHTLSIHVYCAGCRHCLILESLNAKKVNKKTSRGPDIKKLEAGQSSDVSIVIQDENMNSKV